MELKDLSVDQREKLRGASSMEEIVAIAKEEGVELTEEQLDAIAGGVDWLDCTSYTCNHTPCDGDSYSF